MASINTTIRRNDESHLRLRPSLLGEHTLDKDSKQIKPVLNKPFRARCSKAYIYDTQGCVHRMSN